MWEYQAQPVNVVDGDTIDVVVDLGFKITREIRLRLAGVDTHETYGVSHDSDEYEQGKRESEFVREWLAKANGSLYPIIVRTEKRGKYGRYIATIERKTDGEILNDRLIREFDVAND